MATLLLSVGHDSALLAIRNLMLAGAGYTVISASTPQEFVTRFFDGDFDAVVLCDSLPEDQRKRMAEIVHEHSPSTPVVLMRKPLPNSRADLREAIINGDSRDLVRMLPQVLHRQNTGHV